MADAATDDARVIETLNKSFERGRNPSVKLLGGRIISYDRCGALVAHDHAHIMHAVQLARVHSLVQWRLLASLCAVPRTSRSCWH